MDNHRSVLCPLTLQAGVRNCIFCLFFRHIGDISVIEGGDVSLGLLKI